MWLTRSRKSSTGASLGGAKMSLRPLWVIGASGVNVFEGLFTAETREIAGIARRTTEPRHYLSPGSPDLCCKDQCIVLYPVARIPKVFYEIHAPIMDDWKVARH